MKTSSLAAAVLLLATVAYVHAGPLDPDCTVEKGLKGAAAKATIGVGNRCKPKEVVSDGAKRAAGIDGDKKKERDGIAKKAGKKLVD